MEALVEKAKERPAALLETAAFKAAFKAATGKDLPALQLTPCTGSRTLGCTQCRGGPTPPMEVDEEPVLRRGQNGYADLAIAAGASVRHVRDRGG